MRIYEIVNDTGDWRDQLDDAETNAEIKTILTRFNAKFISMYADDEIYKIDNYVIEVSGDYTDVTEMDRWLNNVNLSYVFPDYDQQVNDWFWKHPTILYHYTPSKNKENILKNGLLANNLTRGLNNRHVGNAIFTTTDPESIDGSAYGDTMIEINTIKMATDKYMPFVEKEPEVVEYEQRKILATKLGIDDYEFYTDDAGVSTETLVIRDYIPPKYLTVME